MNTTATEVFALQFADAMSRLRGLGLKGEVSVAAGVVMIATTDKISASGWRKAIRRACERTGAVSTERRPAGSYVFAIAC